MGRLLMAGRKDFAGDQEETAIEEKLQVLRFAEEDISTEVLWLRLG
jgi:hypothetical protein